MEEDMKQRFINMTEEERQESRKKGLEKIEQKKQAATSYKDDFSDLSFWKHLASTYNVRLPKYYIHCSERGVLTRFIKKVEQHLQEKGYDVKDTWDSFMKSLGYNITITTQDGTKKRTFKDYAIDNPNHPMYALCGLYLEYIHYDVLGE